MQNEKYTGLSEDQYQQLLNSFRDECKALDEGIDQGMIDTAANHLKSVDFDMDMGRIDIDLPSMRSGDLISYINKIDAMDRSELEKTKNFEYSPEEYKKRQGSDGKEYTRYAKLSRIDLIMDRYRFIRRLRLNEPEAWDTVNEICCDD